MRFPFALSERTQEPFKPVSQRSAETTLGVAVGISVIECVDPGSVGFNVALVP